MFKRKHDRNTIKVNENRFRNVPAEIPENELCACERRSRRLKKSASHQCFITLVKNFFSTLIFLQTEKLDRIRKEIDKIESSENALKIKNAELCDSLEVKEEEFRRIVGEKDQVGSGCKTQYNT